MVDRYDQNINMANWINGIDL